MNEHLSQDLIVRGIDDELTVTERFAYESHLAVCEQCRRQEDSLRALSSDIDAAIESAELPSLSGMRLRIERPIDAKSSPVRPLQNPAGVLRRFGAGVALAATLAMGVLLAPRHDGPVPSAVIKHSPPPGGKAQSGAIEVDGETFLPVPYSDLDLSTASPHIVQMQVPLASLAEIGIVLEPISNHIGSARDSEHSALADVLVGADGQPLGVHILGLE